MKKKLLILLITVSMGLSACGVKSLTDAETSVEVEMEEETEAEAVEEKEETDADEMAEAEEIKEYVKGSLTETGWESEWLGIRYTCPEGMIMLTEEQMNEVMGLGQEVLSQDFPEEMIDYGKRNVVCEMACIEEIGITNVAISVEKLPTEITVEQYIKSIEKKIVALDAISYEIVSDDEVVEIGGVDFIKLEYIGEYDGVVKRQNIFVTIRGDRAVQIVVTYLDETMAIADAIMNGFSAYVETEAEEIMAAEAEAEETTSYVKGSLTETGWESEWLGIRYICPEGMIMLTEEQLNEIMGNELEEISEDFTEELLKDFNLFTVYEMMCSDELGITNVLVTVQKLVVEMTTEQCAENVKKELAALIAISYENISSGEVVVIGGTEFIKIECVGSVEGITLYQDVYVAVKEDRMILVLMSYIDETVSVADTIMNGFVPLVHM